MGAGAGGGGNGGRPGGGGGGQSGQPQPGDTALTANMRKYYEPGGATVQQFSDGGVQATHPAATIRIYADRSAEVWSSRDGTKAFKPQAGRLQTYKDPMKALGEFEKRTGIIT